jgi:hypothetical protein
MFNGWKLIFSATCFLFLPAAALAALQELPANVSAAAVQTHPTKQFSDSELLAFIAEQKRQNANSMIMQLQSPESFLVDELGLVAGQIDQIKEEHARLVVLTQKLADKFNEQRKTTTDSAKIDELKTEYREELSKTFDEYLVELQREVFLPHQNKKFDIICRQSLVSQLRNATAGKATWERVVTEYVQLAPEDLDRLSKAVEKASQELAEIDSEARHNAVRQAVRALPEKKRLLLEQWALGDIETMARLLKIAEN